MATVLQEQPRVIASTPEIRPWNVDRLAFAGVAFLVVALAIPQLTWFWEHSRGLWYGIVHDRNAYFCQGLELGLDLRHGNLSGLLHHLDGLRLRGPVNALLIAPLQLTFGPDYRLAIIPSWLAWIGAALYGFLLARRMAPTGGNLAGLVTTLFILVAPAERAFATDIMLESLGGGLSLLCLYLYVVAVQDAQPKRGLWLGTGLTVLFLLKPNYWLLIAAGIFLAELTRQPRVYCSELVEVQRRVSWPAFAARQLRHPLTYIIAGLVALVAWITVTGGVNLRLGRTDISITKPHNAVHLAYIAFFIRLVQWWRAPAVRAFWQTLPAVFRQAAGLHGWVIALNFLLPQRLANFFWYVSSSHMDLPPQKIGFLGGAPYYLRAMMDDYHVAAWSLFLVAGLIAIAVVSCRQWKPGSGVVFWFLLISAFLTFQHPLPLSRFMHSWIAAEWVLAGVGLAAGMQMLARTPAWRTPVLVCASLAIIGAHVPHLLLPGRSPEGGVDETKLTTLPVVETYLPLLENARNPTLLSNMPIRDLQAWSYQQAYSRQRFSVDIKKLGADSATHQAALEQWLKTTATDAVVLVDIRPDSPYFCKTTENREVTLLRAFLKEQPTFRMESDRELPDVAVRVTVWRHQEAGTSRRTDHIDYFAWETLPSSSSR